MGVDLIEANGRTSDAGKATDLFPAGASKYLGITNHAIEGIEEVDGVIKFKYKGGVENPDTAIEDAEKTADIIAIYNILGQKQTTTDIEVLTTGTYIVVTSSGSYKMVR